MKVQGRKALLLLGIAFIVAIAFSMTTIEAKAATTLIKIEGKKITSDMKIKDVKKLFGEPKLTTDSYFGGKAYTFYKGNYDDYLYIETDKSGAIACYGSLDDSFVTADYSYGDEYRYTVYRGYEAANDSDQVYGIIRFTKQCDAWAMFIKNAAVNNVNMAKHTVLMWNAINYMYDGGPEIEYNADVYAIAAQLAENNCDMDTYCTNTSKFDYYEPISISTEGFEEYHYPNPLMMAQYAIGYDIDSEFYPAFTFWQSDNGYYMHSTGFASIRLLSDWESVSLTAAENKLLTEVKKHYKASVDYINNAEDYYDIEPDYSSASDIVGGVLNADVGRGTTELLNAIRVGAGIPAVEYSAKVAECAQAKATYMVYLSNNDIDYADPHFPEQADEISDEYYEKCQKYMSENLYYTGIINSHVIGSITNALCDSYAEPTCGHRYNLLYPSHKYLGVGSTDNQGCHKLTGTQSYDVDVVAWPSKGIMPSESGFDPSHMMTCQFYNGMKPTADTVVTITCLNTGDKWTVDPDTADSKGQHISVSGSMISFKEPNVLMRDGGVYTFHYTNLKDSSGKLTDYEYRTVYVSVYEESDGGSSSVTSVSLNKSKLVLKKGEAAKVKVTIKPSDAENKRIIWSSSNKAVAKVNQYGMVTAVGEGTAKIKATAEDGGAVASCTVTVHNYGKWITDKKATCLKSGTRHRVCECGSKATETIPAKGHSWAKNYTVDKKATTKATGSKSKYCISCKAFKSGSKVIIAKIEKTSADNLVYNGKNRTSNVKVVNSKGRKLVKGTDYTVTYKNAKGTKAVTPKNVGKYKAVIKFKGQYGGTVTKTFKINPQSTKITSLSKNGRKQFTVGWKKKTVQVTGYEIRYSASSNMSNAKTVTVTKAKTTKKTIKRLTPDKKYYVQIRTYKKVNGTKYYSAWSKTKSVKTK